MQITASRSGLRDGDFVVEGIGRAIEGIDNLRKYRTDAHVGVRSALTVIRCKEKLLLGIVPEDSAVRNN